uniref:Uncharacterized protein n=1 Tax=Setaria viridis TaxID=4556 RepID=A0A4U6TDY2_SETVI|nr:hypothetical protein SEVIR_8G103866v2 [Setaria viridis]
MSRTFCWKLVLSFSNILLHVMRFLSDEASQFF